MPSPTVSPHDRDVLRRLAEEQARIAALPVHKQTADAWRRLNGLRKGRPLVWINEIPWHEMNVNDELTPQTTDPFCRAIETDLRRTLYQWRHLPVDMVVAPTFPCRAVIHDTGFGIKEEAAYAFTDTHSDIKSREFHPQITCEADLEKIKMPRITLDEAATQARFRLLTDLFGDLLTIEMRGIGQQWFAPWDELIRWWSVEQAMIDLVDKPDLVHAAMDRLVGAYLHRLDQLENLNLLSLDNGNYRIGSGGLGYTDELPQPDFDPAHVRPRDQWGCATAQIFSDVSPEMHEAFALQYERRWLDRFGLTYYGCCEPLHVKLLILRSVKNLRKVSMSPWVDVSKAVAMIGDRYVFSHKPNPAVLATDTFHLDQARANLERVLDQTRGCVVEVILKDISTVRYEPQRLWQWAEMAMATVRKA